MPVQTDPYSFTNGTVADADQVNARFLKLYQLQNPAIIGIDDSNVKAAGLTDASLASPTSPVWRTVLAFDAVIINLTTASFAFRGTDGQPSASGSNMANAKGLWLPPSASDVAVAGKTTRLRLRVPWITNATAPGVNVTWGLYPLTAVAGVSGVVTPTLGTVLAGSGAVATAPAASSGGTATGASFDFSTLAGGTAYMLGVTGSGSQPVASLMFCEVILEMRHT